MPTLEYNFAVSAIKSYEKLLTNKKTNTASFEALGTKANLSATDQKKIDAIAARMNYAPGSDARIEADQCIELYTSGKNRLVRSIQDGKKVVSTLKGELESLISKRKSRPVEHAFERVLEKYDIVYQQHYTMTLIGEHCHRWLVNHEDILEEARTVFVDGLSIEIPGVANKSEGEKAALMEIIDILLIQMKDIMSVLDFIIATMREQRKHDDEECKLFEKSCKYLGMRWREYGLSPTPKLHSLERHVPDFMWRYRRLFGEDSIERGHATKNRFNRCLQCVRRWDDKIDIRERRIGAGNLGSVAEAVKDSALATGRIFSPPVMEKKRAASSEKKETKDERRNFICQKIMEEDLTEITVMAVE